MTQTVNINGVGMVNFPDDYTPERIQFAIEKDILPKMQEAKPNKAEVNLQKRRDSAAGLGRGLMDVGQGLKQGALMVKDMFTGGNEAGPYTSEKTDEVNLYEKGRDPNSIDGPRLVGNVLGTAPAALIPGGQAAALPIRMLSGGGQGAASSAAMFTPEGKSKGEQTAVGALFGGVAPAVMEGGRQVVSRVGDFFRGKTAVAIPQLTADITLKLEQQGIDFNKLTQQARDSLVSDAQKALSAGGTLDDVMLANKATIESVGAKPTRASVTRDPKDWQTEQNLRGVTNVGESIAKRAQENATALTDYLGKLRTSTGGKSSTAYEAGESAVNAIKVQDKAKERAVSELYDAYRESGLKDAAVPEARLMSSLTKIIDEVGLDNVPPAVQSRLKDFGFLGGERKRNLTVQEADTFNRLLNANNPGHGPQSKTIGMLKGALNESLIETPGAGAPLTKAREAAAQRFAEQDASKGIAAAIDDVSPDRFVKKFIMDADVREVRATLAELNKSDQGKQSIKDIKGHVFDNLLMKATGATSADDVAGRGFSGVNFSKALDSIAPEKLHQLFSPSEVESLRALQKASRLLTEEVPYSDVNHSKTSAALANILQKVGSTPLLGPIVSPIIGAGKIGTDWVKNATDRKAVAEALLGSAGKARERTSIAPYKLERLAPAATAGMAYQAGQEPNQ